MSPSIIDQVSLFRVRLVWSESTKMVLQVIAMVLLLISLPLEAGFLMPIVNGIFSLSIILAIISLILSGLSL